MAQSRLEKIGTIFSRTTGLLRAGAVKSEEKPIWYDVYAAFPPKLEPRYDRPAPNVPIRNIFYKEDQIRAKFHKSLKHVESVNLADTKRETQTQHFIEIYNGLVEQGPLDQEQVFETAKELLAEQRQQARSEMFAKSEDASLEQVKAASNLVTNFNEATKVKRAQHDKETDKKSYGIDIKNLFKD